MEEFLQRFTFFIKFRSFMGIMLDSSSIISLTFSVTTSGLSKLSGSSSASLNLKEKAEQIFDKVLAYVHISNETT